MSPRATIGPRPSTFDRQGLGRLVKTRQPESNHLAHGGL
jgi:hypothetical protein